MGDIGRAMKAARKERHAKWREDNIAVIQASGLRFQERSAALLFRNAGGPKADFYPGTGRWVEADKPGIHRGGASAFLLWYAMRAKNKGRRSDECS